MSSVITLESVDFTWPDGRSVFTDLNLAFGPRRTGIVGRNGVGKTTFLNLASGELAPTAGVVRRHGDVAVLRQIGAGSSTARVRDLLGVAEELDRLDRIERGIASDADFESADWTLEQEVEAALLRMGLRKIDDRRLAGSLSGGELTRVNLAALLLTEPAAILLDEPTNNLDSAGRAAVAQLLAAWEGCAMVVSHDRDLLGRVDDIVELSGLGARSYGGAYDLYRSRRDAEAEAASRALDDAEKTLEKTRREAQLARERKARRDAAGRRAKARGDQPKIVLNARAGLAETTSGRLNTLAQRLETQARESLEAARSRVERTRGLALDLPPSGLALGKSVLVFDDVSFGWDGGRVMFDSLSFRMTGPERVAVAGANGSGKTTFVRLAIGDLKPDRGRVELGVRAVVLDQQVGLLHEADDLIANYRRLNPTADDRQAHAALARFLFRNTAALTPVRQLSGGERVRAGLACALMAPDPPRLIILDEPTNHMDVDSIEAIEDALLAYDGALIVISHDLKFLDAVGITRSLDLG